MKAHTDGYVPFRGYQTYYKIFGKPSRKKAPLLVLHGGPGSCHNYVLSLAYLAKDRQVVFYDQIGCGQSDRPEDIDWTVELFLDEVQAVRKHLDLSEIHLLGHSWGGMLAIEYLLTKPKGVKSTILASAMISMPLYQAEVEILKQDLPPEIYKTMRAHEKAGTTDSHAYAQAMRYYGRRHLFRGEAFPKEFDNPPETVGKAAYNALWGPSEAFANGSLKKWTKSNSSRIYAFQP